MLYFGFYAIDRQFSEYTIWKYLSNLITFSVINEQ